MCESQNIQRFVLVWRAVKSADADLRHGISQNGLGTPVQKKSPKFFSHCEN